MENFGRVETVSSKRFVRLKDMGERGEYWSSFVIYPHFISCLRFEVLILHFLYSGTLSLGMGMRWEGATSLYPFPICYICPRFLFVIVRII